MIESARKRLAQRIRLLRTNRGWSQEVLAELSGLNRSYIGAIERAEHNIGLDNIERIAHALETSVRHLVDEEEPRQHPLPPGARGPQPAAAPARQAVVHRRIFLELLEQCGQQRRDLVLIYLERCGVKVLD